MLRSKDFSAWVAIEGVKVPEYGVEVSENGQDITCWIPSEVGKKFSVNWTNISAPGLTGGGVQVDGLKCGFEAIAAEMRPISAFMDGIAETDTKTRPFEFAPLELTDDDSYLDSSSHPHLGLIKLEIWRVDVAGGYAPSVVAVPAAQKVHERAKKAMNQQIKFGAAVEHAQVQSAQIRRVGFGPLVAFSFKYRSLDVLKANGIAPPTPRPEKRKATGSPEPASNDNGPAPSDDADADAAEAAKINEHLATLTAKRAKPNPKTIKTEPSNGSIPTASTSDLKKIKLEQAEMDLKRL
ncbi:hypothetical protein C8F04DRAFT_1145798 [Mycena alexandri]|uniref:DUF7918 domain-containing protein n=1 Tax=Mycena alexandri TaxID=1745969 RepID=A0AAD6S3R1_9AGAR|nr:hypothetical protein C8F04DRAFT_1145798 [Mycena alexandri]